MGWIFSRMDDLPCLLSLLSCRREYLLMDYLLVHMYDDKPVNSRDFEDEANDSGSKRSGDRYGDKGRKEGEKREAESAIKDDSGKRI